MDFLNFHIVKSPPHPILIHFGLKCSSQNLVLEISLPFIPLLMENTRFPYDNGLAPLPYTGRKTLPQRRSIQRRIAKYELKVIISKPSDHGASVQHIHTSYLKCHVAIFSLVLTNIYSLLIVEDLCDSRNVSIKFRALACCPLSRGRRPNAL